MMAESRDRGEPVEITALRTNLNVITRAVTVGPTLHWFANCLVEKSLISRQAAQGILHQDGTTRISKANELLDSVFNNIRATQAKRHRFNEFVSIFSNDPVYEDLVTNLQSGVVQVVSNLPLHFSSESAYTPDLLSPTSPSSTSTVLDSGVEESSDASPLDNPPVTGPHSSVESSTPATIYNCSASDAPLPAPPTPETKPLGIKDLFSVCSELVGVAHKWKKVGLALRLHPDLLDRIEAKKNDVEDNLSDTLKEWLKKSYDTESFGDPSWKLLVDAVAHRAGGKDRALAMEIAAKYDVPPPQ
ncbi:hypothetical protein GBAR_LOCUS12695 [Geodia barretti]|uniref:Death domain-containing protein n=1 Tax=Geodia barretti TaxID=519541 RepID=A0AA35WLH7_GEOBA|nr:hypothetical protein GBAR_LOCUS12695 [Geodia barretti]